MRPLFALLLVLLAGPAAAQVTGECRDGSLWWQAGAFAGLGPCEAPQEGFFVLACPTGAVTLDVDSPFEAEEDAPVSARVEVDGTPFEVEGRAVRFAQTDSLGMAEAPVPDALLDALAAGRGATFALPTEERTIHLAGSSAAIGAMRANCGG